jgi:hypothetical protein
VSPVAIAIVALAPLIAIPLIGSLVCLLLSLVSGWQRLAARYPATQPARGARFGAQSAGIGGVSYRNCLTIHVAADGLFLSMPIILRVGHPPLFIPWHAATKQETVKFLWSERVRLEIGSPPIGRLQLEPRVLEARNQAQGGASR